MPAELVTVLKIQCQCCKRSIRLEGRTVENTTRMAHQEGWTYVTNDWVCPSDSPDHQRARERRQ